MPTPTAASTPTKNTTLGLIIALAILCAIGFLVLYLKTDMQAKQAIANQNRLIAHINALETRLADQEQATISADNQIKTPMQTNEVSLPVITYIRPGLLLNKPAEKERLQKKLIDPFFDYHNESQIEYIVMVIDVPSSIGEPYRIEAINKNGGSMGFLYGKREQELPYWLPACDMDGDCHFSEAFKKKYPAIVNAPSLTP